MTKRLFITLGSLLAVVVVAICVVVAILNHRKDVEPTFDELLVEDYNYAKAYAESVEKTLNFYEVQTVLNTELSEDYASDTVKVVSMKVISQIGDSVMFINRNLVDNTYEVEMKAGLWVGDHCMEDPSTFSFTLTEALEQLKVSGLTTAGNKMTLRSPLGPELMNPLYIFGQHNTGCAFIAIDAITGEVITLEADGLVVEQSQSDSAPTVE